MERSEDGRKYKRLNTHWIAKIRSSLAPSGLRNAGDTVIKNISMGGVFIETSVPFTVGTFVELDFTVPGNKDVVHAEGVVRWSGGAQSSDCPAGMGIEFIRVSTKSKSTIVDYIEEATAIEFLSVLTQTELHKKLLKFYCRKIGESFELDVLAKFLSCGHPELLGAIRHFVERKLVNFSGKNVVFLQPDNTMTSDILREWYKQNP